MPMRALIAGCGYVGTALGRLLASEGLEVYGLRRDPSGLPPEIRPLPADLSRPESLRGIPGDIALLFYTAAAGGGDDAAYRAAYVDGPRHLLEAMADRPPRRALFTSSTGVYAQDDGAFVDEESPAEPVHFSGRRLLEGERLFAESGVPSVVLRLGGIYGPGRTRLLDGVRQGRATLRRGPPVFTNRIHRDDCAGALAHLASLRDPAPCYLGVDRDPADEGVVLRWLATRLGAPEPREIEAVDPSASPANGSRRERSNKRCRSDRLVASGYRFRFPTFREGYESVLRGLGLVLALFLALTSPAPASEASKPPPAFRTSVRADHPLAGKVYDVRAGVFLAPEALVERLSAAPLVLLGERHDQPDHHALQAWLVEGIAARGARPVVAFEMLDASQAAALDRHLSVSPRDADGLGAAVGWEKTGWPEFAIYRPIFEATLGAGLPIRAANLGREETRTLGRAGQAALPPELVARLGLAEPLPEAQRAAIEREIVEGHCGHVPAAALPGMITVQRARDAHMAAVLHDALAHGSALLVAGNGHVRRDHGVPARLRERGGPEAVGVGMLEVIDGQDDARRYAVAGEDEEILFDYVWLTPRVDEVDPCVRFREQLEGLRSLEGRPAPEAAPAP